MVNYREMLLTLIGGDIERKYHVEVVEILSDVIFKEDKDDQDYIDFSMTVRMMDEKDYEIRPYRVYGFISYLSRDIIIGERRLLAD